MKKLIPTIMGCVLAGLLLAATAQASTEPKAAPVVEIRIDISSQAPAVNVNGWPYGRWMVSTARDEGYHTPRGSRRPFAMKKIHYSRKYDNSPMSNSIFFLGGYATHGTNYLRSLGRPASHGCIRATRMAITN